MDIINKYLEVEYRFSRMVSVVMSHVSLWHRKGEVEALCQDVTTLDLKRQKVSREENPGMLRLKSSARAG